MEPARPLPVDPKRPRRMVQADGTVVRRALIDDPELNAMRAADLAEYEALGAWSPRNRRRLGLYVLGSMIAWPLANWLLTTVGFHVLWVQILVAAAYGAFVALVRPGMALCAGATVAAGALIHTAHRLDGGSAPHFYMLLALTIYAGFGAVLGFTESNRQVDR